MNRLVRALDRGRSILFAMLIGTIVPVFSGCRSVIPAHDLLGSSAPNISRIMLKKGDSVIVFNRDFGWYNKRAGLIEGISLDSQHVECRLSDIRNIETVRNYSLIPAIFAGVAVVGTVLYLMAKLLSLL
jgi:hypothetical protein